MLFTYRVNYFIYLVAIFINAAKKISIMLVNIVKKLQKN